LFVQQLQQLSLPVVSHGHAAASHLDEEASSPATNRMSNLRTVDISALVAALFPGCPQQPYSQVVPTPAIEPLHYTRAEERHGKTHHMQWHT